VVKILFRIRSQAGPVAFANQMATLAPLKQSTIAESLWVGDHLLPPPSHTLCNNRRHRSLPTSPTSWTMSLAAGTCGLCTRR